MWYDWIISGIVNKFLEKSITNTSLYLFILWPLSFLSKTKNGYYISGII